MQKENEGKATMSPHFQHTQRKRERKRRRVVLATLSRSGRAQGKSQRRARADERAERVSVPRNDSFGRGFLTFPAPRLGAHSGTIRARSTRRFLAYAARRRPTRTDLAPRTPDSCGLRLRSLFPAPKSLFLPKRGGSYTWGTLAVRFTGRVARFSSSTNVASWQRRHVGSSRVLGHFLKTVFGLSRKIGI